MSTSEVEAPERIALHPSTLRTQQGYIYTDPATFASCDVVYVRADLVSPSPSVDNDLAAHVLRVLLYASNFGDSVCLCGDDQPKGTHDDECEDAQRLWERCISPSVAANHFKIATDFAANHTVTDEKDAEYDQSVNQSQDLSTQPERSPFPASGALTLAQQERLEAHLPLMASGADAVAWHLEQGEDNGGISREALALAMRSYATACRAFPSAIAVTKRAMIQRVREMAESYRETAERWHARAAKQSDPAFAVQDYADRDQCFAKRDALALVAFELEKE